MLFGSLPLLPNLTVLASLVKNIISNWNYKKTKIVTNFDIVTDEKSTTIYQTLIMCHALIEVPLINGSGRKVMLMRKLPR